MDWQQSAVITYGLGNKVGLNRKKRALARKFMPACGTHVGRFWTILMLTYTSPSPLPRQVIFKHTNERYWVIGRIMLRAGFIVSNGHYAYSITQKGRDAVDALMLEVEREVNIYLADLKQVEIDNKKALDRRPVKKPVRPTLPVKPLSQPEY